MKSEFTLLPGQECVIASACTLSFMGTDMFGKGASDPVVAAMFEADGAGADVTLSQATECDDHAVVVTEADPP